MGLVKSLKVKVRHTRLINMMFLHLLTLLVVPSLFAASVRASSAPPDKPCSCSPFSGNSAGNCCDGAGNNTCGSWFHHEACDSTRPVCCTSSFGSACCPAGNACSPGCRNSLAGGCACLPSPSLRSVGFNRTEAVRVLGLNAATQCNPRRVANWTCVSCNASMYGDHLHDINVTESKGHMAFTAWDDNEEGAGGTGKIRVALRGSLSVQDWISDADFLKVGAYADLGCEGCGVERGFLDAYRDLQPGVEASVAALLAKHPHAPITLTGHSLGAAMATHAAIAFKLVRNWTIEPVTYTFGQPRAGDGNFAAWFSRHFPGWLRSVHWNDPVPHLPPAGMLGYHHVSRELWWTSDSGEAAIVCDASGEDKNCSDSIVVPTVFTDHWYYLGYPVCNCVPFAPL